MRFISSLVFMYVRIMNEASRKLTQKVYSLSKFRRLVISNWLHYLLHTVIYPRSHHLVSKQWSMELSRFNSGDPFWWILNVNESFVSTTPHHHMVFIAAPYLGIIMSYSKNHQQFNRLLCWRVHLLQSLPLKIKWSTK